MTDTSDPDMPKIQRERWALDGPTKGATRWPTPSGPNSVPTPSGASDSRFPGSEEPCTDETLTASDELVSVPPLSNPHETFARDGRHWRTRERDLELLLRKEVIQPHLPVRLPCYDFVPIANPTFDGSLHKGWATGFGCYRLS